MPCVVLLPVDWEEATSTKLFLVTIKFWTARIYGQKAIQITIINLLNIMRQIE